MRKGFTNQVREALRSAGRPIGHYEIAGQIEESPWRVCVALHSLQRRGEVLQLKKSRPGPNPPESSWVLGPTNEILTTTAARAAQPKEQNERAK